jgi:hypothetical protein
MLCSLVHGSSLQGYTASQIHYCKEIEFLCKEKWGGMLFLVALFMQKTNVSGTVYCV